MVEDIMNKLGEVEKAIKATEALNQEAVTMKKMFEQQLTEKDAELVKLGTTPEKGRQDVANMDATINETLKKINEMLPIALLKKTNRL